ncbi:MAG: putative PEP-binding protein, partial [Prochlorococcaceae cyanobacterium]
DSALVADLFDERNAAVKAMIAMAIATARRCGRKVGICGQAPSDHPDFAEFLLAEGIDSISLNPDAVISTRIAVAKLEARLQERPQVVVRPAPEEPSSVEANGVIR